MILFILFVLTFVSGLMFGYMVFHTDLNTLLFEFKSGGKTHNLKINKRVTVHWNKVQQYDYFELKEIN